MNRFVVISLLLLVGLGCHKIRTSTLLEEESSHQEEMLRPFHGLALGTSGSNNRLQDLNPTAADLSSDMKVLAVLGYGSRSCNGLVDGIVLFDLSKDEEVNTIGHHCGLYEKSSAESLAIIEYIPNEKVSVLVAAEQIHHTMICEADLKTSPASIDCKNHTKFSDFHNGGEMQENSGIDVVGIHQSTSSGLIKPEDLWVMPDSSQFLWVYGYECYIDATLCEDPKVKLTLPRYLQQAEDLAIAKCPNHDSEKGELCTYVGDIGRYGTSRLYVIPHKTVDDLLKGQEASSDEIPSLELNPCDWRYYNLDDYGKDWSDSEAMTIFEKDQKIFALVIHKNSQGTLWSFEMRHEDLRYDSRCTSK